MNYRSGLIQASKDMGEAGTETIDIKFKQLISRIEITFETHKLLHEMAAGGPANLPKIELVDGSTPLHSLSGYCNQALAYYSRGAVAMENGVHVATLHQIDRYTMDFGRFLHDPLLAFDPTKFSNPQLKITWDENASDINVTANALEIWAELFDEKVISPIGFLSARELWSSAMGVDTAYTDVDIPEDEVIRQILVRAYKDGVEPTTQIDEVRLDENVEQRIPFDYADLGAYVERMKAVWPMVKHELYVEDGTAGRLYYIAPTNFMAHVLLLPVNDNGYPYLETASPFATGGKVTIFSSLTYTQLIGIAEGYLPWHCFQFPMGKQDDISDWYDPKDKKPRLRLRAGSSGTGGTGTVVIETVKKY